MPVLTKPNWKYWADFFIYPALLYIAWQATKGERAAMGLAWYAGAVLGVFAFTFAEYVTHRWVLHLYTYMPSHEEHHRHPESYVVFPVWAVPLGFVGLAFLSMLFLSSLAPWFGFTVGYVWFFVWHHYLHHFNLEHQPQWVRDYAAWHDEHHRNIKCNYGTTSPLWDVLFCTYRKPRRVRKGVGS